MDGENGRRRIHPMKSTSGVPSGVPVCGRGRRFERHRGYGAEEIVGTGNPDRGERVPDRDGDERCGQGGNPIRTKPYPPIAPPMAGSAGSRNDAVPRMRPFGFRHRIYQSQAGATAAPCRRGLTHEGAATKIARDTSSIPRSSD